MKTQTLFSGKWVQTAPLADEELRQRWHDMDRGKRICQWGCTVLVNGQFIPGHHVHMD